MHSQYIVLPESLSFSKIFSVKPEPLTTLWYICSIHRVFARIDVRALEDVLGEWLQTVTPLAKGEGIGDTPAAQKIAQSVRGHWGIENRLYRQRDTVFREDHGTIRKGSAPQAMAALRNLVISIWTIRSFPKAQRRFAAKPSELFAFLGLTEVQKQYVYA